MQRLDWFDLRNMLTVARAVTQAALLRTEKPRRPPARGFSRDAPAVAVNQVIRRRGQDIDISRRLPLPWSRRAISETAILKIWRGQDKNSGHWKPMPCRFERGQSVLDGLRYIRITKDPSLAIRFSCINATPARNA